MRMQAALRAAVAQAANSIPNGPGSAALLSALAVAGVTPLLLSGLVRKEVAAAAADPLSPFASLELVADSLVPAQVHMEVDVENLELMAMDSSLAPGGVLGM